MKRSLLISAALFGLLGVPAAGITFYQWIGAEPIARDLSPPEPTRWKPVGPRKAGRHDYSVIPIPNAFHTMHVGLDNTDELWTVVAPVVELDWVAETEMYVAEGPTFDDQGNLYVSPFNPEEDVSLVALDAMTGERRWSVPGRGAGNGAILILNDPNQPGEQIVYHSTYANGMALRTDGSKVWETPTGLTSAETPTPLGDHTHIWGMNYHPPADAVIGVTMDGYVYAFDRRTGRRLLDEPYRLPGSRSAVTRTVPTWLSSRADRETDAVFGRSPDGKGLFTGIADVIFGNGFIVANFFGIQPETGRIYIAATAPDEQDGSTDGVSANGMIFLLELHARGDGGWELRESGRYAFSGGTGSTPTIRPDGERVALSDDHGNVIVLDAVLNEIWRENVGAQIAASIAVSSENDELYAVTARDVFKLRDRGSHGEIVWRAQLDAYPGFDNFNALTPTIAANGIAISLGAGRELRGQQIMHKVGVGVLDRETGALRSFAEGREESIAVTSIGPDGGFYMANSPVRRAATRGLLGDRVPPLVGGIQRYRPVRLDLLIRDAMCASRDRAANALTIEATHPASARIDALQIHALVVQSRGAIAAAVEEGSIDTAHEAELARWFGEIEAAVQQQDFREAERAASAACDRTP